MKFALDSLLQPVIEVSKEAGQAILSLYRKPEFLSTRYKPDSTPVTEADFLANQIIVNHLSKLTPEIPILSEEGTAIPFEERKQWEYFWLIDPLDGTKEFICETDDFTVNIALVHQHRPILGVIYLPVEDVCYYAIQGQGAFKQSADGVTQTIHVRPKVGNLIVVVVSRRHGTDQVHRFLENIGSHQVLQRGSSLKACLVAEGAADIYPGFGLTSEWDTAASQCIVEEAGGQLINARTLQPLSYNMQESLSNPGFLVVGDAKHNWGELFYGREKWQKITSKF